MWASVPQSPTADTRTSTSYGEIIGRGTSRTSILATSQSTLALIVGLVPEIELFFLINVGAIKRHLTSSGLFQDRYRWCPTSRHPATQRIFALFLSHLC